jgi:hypothetical protein
VRSQTEGRVGGKVVYITEGGQRLAAIVPADYAADLAEDLADAEAIAALLAQFCKQSRALTLAKIRSCATSGTGSHTAVAATHRSGS